MSSSAYPCGFPGEVLQKKLTEPKNSEHDVFARTCGVEVCARADVTKQGFGIIRKTKNAKTRGFVLCECGVLLETMTGFHGGLVTGERIRLSLLHVAHLDKTHRIPIVFGSEFRVSCVED